MGTFEQVWMAPTGELFIFANTWNGINPLAGPTHRELTTGPSQYQWLYDFFSDAGFVKLSDL